MLGSVVAFGEKCWRTTSEFNENHTRVVGSFYLLYSHFYVSWLSSYNHFILLYMLTIFFCMLLNETSYLPPKEKKKKPASLLFFEKKIKKKKKAEKTEANL